MEDTNSRKVVLRLGFEISIDEVIEILEKDMSEILESVQKVKDREVRFYVQRNWWVKSFYDGESAEFIYMLNGFEL
jgi:metal-sulfur cluster biosynthetic enzyme